MNNKNNKEIQRVQITDQLVNEIVQKIVEHFHPLKIIIFGSYVWGKRRADSDLDLLVIMESQDRPAQRARKIRKICRPRFLPMDILVRTPQEIQRRLEMNDFFIKEILEKGRVKYVKETRGVRMVYERISYCRRGRRCTSEDKGDKSFCQVKTGIRSVNHVNNLEQL